MSTLRFEPIAIQLGKHTSPALLFPADVLEAVRQNTIMDRMDPAWTPIVREFMSHYAAVIEMAHLLLGAPPFARLARLYDELKDEYTPDEEQASPVYDSHLVQHVLGGIPQGVAGETPLGVLARLARGDATRTRLQELAQSLASSHLDLYRVTRVSDREGEVEPLRGAEPFSLHIAGPFLREGDRVLGRVVEFDGRRFMADSPYLLEASDEEWLDYLERATQADGGPALPFRDEAPRAKPKLTSKQAARRRKELKVKAARNTPNERVVRHLRYGPSERFWLEYVMFAFAGARRGIVRLAGVPDRPATLPDHPEYAGPELEVLDGAELDGADDELDAFDDAFDDDDGFADDLSPMARVREKLEVIAEREGLFEREERALMEALRELGATPELHESDEPLLTAYCTLGALTRDGTTALERLSKKTTLEDDERAVVTSLERGRFAVLRLDRIHLDEGFEAFDVLRQEKLRIEERSATRQVALGDLLLGWVCVEAAGGLTFEGGTVRVPSLLAAPLGEVVVSLRAEPPARLPLELLARLVALREHPPLPELFNMSGDRFQLATARYAIQDRARVLAGLAAAGFEATPDGGFIWVSEDGTRLASLELRAEQLFVHVNSLERLRAAKERIEAALGDAVKSQLATLEGDMPSLLAKERSKGGAARGPDLDVAALPPEARAQIHGLLLNQVRKRFDDPIPALNNQSLRQAARGKASQADAVSWLREQERIFRFNPQMEGLDMRPLWRELGLEYQGLDTDPR
jgi:hypothetical protein